MTFSENDMKQMAHESVDHGCTMGELALGEFLLKNHKEELSDFLKKYLQKVVDDAYKQLGHTFGQPAEDVALSVAEMFKRANNFIK